MEIKSSLGNDIRKEDRVFKVRGRYDSQMRKTQKCIEAQRKEMIYRVITSFNDDKHDWIAADPRYPSCNFAEISEKPEILVPDPGVRTFK